MCMMGGSCICVNVFVHVGFIVAMMILGKCF